jgi:hypothetical protein
MVWGIFKVFITREADVVCFNRKPPSFEIKVSEGLAIVRDLRDAVFVAIKHYAKCCVCGMFTICYNSLIFLTTKMNERARRGKGRTIGTDS